MMKTMEFIADMYPQSFRMFDNSLYIEYGIDSKEFANTGIFRQLSFVKRFFGYSSIVDISVPESEAVKEIIHIFEDYESLMIRYPDGVPDKLRILNHMSNLERPDYFEKDTAGKVRISLCHALCRISHGNRLSLKDSLVPRVLSTLDQIVAEKLAWQKSEEEFWNLALKQSREKVEAPF